MCQNCSCKRWQRLVHARISTLSVMPEIVARAVRLELPDCRPWLERTSVALCCAGGFFGYLSNADYTGLVRGFFRVLFYPTPVFPKRIPRWWLFGASRTQFDCPTSKGGQKPQTWLNHGSRLVAKRPEVIENSMIFGILPENRSV